MTGWRTFLSALNRELVFLWRSPWDLALNTVLPAFLIVVMALLFLGGTPRNLPVAVVDADHSTLSRDAIRLLDASPGAAVVDTKEDLSSAFTLIRDGRAFGVFYIPQNAARDMRNGRRANFVFYTAAPYYTASVTLAREGSNIVSALGGKFLREEIARRDSAHVRAAPIAVQSTTLFNSGFSYELMIVSLLHPAIIIILMSVAAMSAVGREFSACSFSGWVAAPAQVVPALCGKFLPYLLLYFLYATICIIWLAWWRGYPVQGSVFLLMVGYGVMLLVYALLGVALVSVTRDIAMALGGAAVYASSAMAFSGALFPMRGAPLFAQSWNAIQPYTWYSRISASLWQMGAPVSAVSCPLRILFLMVVVTGLGAWAGLYFAAREAQRGEL